MEIIDKLEERIDSLLGRLRHLEQENASLREQLANERGSKDEVTTRIDQLLKKIQEEFN